MVFVTPNFPSSFSGRKSVGKAAAVGAICLLLLAAFVIYQGITSANILHAFRATVVGLAGFVAVQLVAQVPSRLRNVQFAGLFAGSQNSYFLTDFNGAVLTGNAKFDQEFIKARRVNVAAICGDFFVGSGGNCGQFLRQAAVAGTAQIAGDFGSIRAERVGSNRLLWLKSVGVSAEILPTFASVNSASFDEKAFQDLPVALLRLGMDGRIDFINKAGKSLLGDAAQPKVDICDLLDGLWRSMRERLVETATAPAKARSEMARRISGDQNVFFQVNLLRVDSIDGPQIIATMNDATELKSLEAQFVQSQKMQAVGQLAGGIAHDFNNLLTAINGHCDLLLLRHETGDFDHSDLMQIRANALRAAALVRQLLAFSRKQTLQPKTIQLTDTLSELAHLLNRLLSEKVSLVIEKCDDLRPVRVDERQFEQVIMNLVVNARDAMPLGGEVRIACENLLVSQDTQRNRANIPAGPYVLIRVSDTGTGISDDEIGKIFEPFYTTKRVGEGTGLGLSTAYGIVKQTGGFIFVDSTLGCGTVFSIYLPASDSETPLRLVADVPPKLSLHDMSGQGKILLAEDETAVRSFTARALRMRGYTVFEACSGEEALQILSDAALNVDLLISDVIMPGLDGPSWVRKARANRPDAKVVFVSGYAEDAFSGGSSDFEHSVFLPKPYSLSDLTKVVKDQLALA